MSTVIAPLLVVSALTLPQDQPPAIHLRHVPQRGRVELYDIASEQEMTVGAGGAAQPARTTLALRCRVEILEVDKEAFTVGIRWQRVKGRMAVPPMLDVPFDSNSKNNDGKADRSIAGRIRDPWLRLVGTEYRARLDHSGKILEMPDLENYLDTVQTRVRKGSNPKTVGGLITEAAWRSQVRMIFPRYPDKPVPVDGQFAGTSRDQVGYGQKILFESTTTSRVAGVEKGLVTLSVTSKEPKVNGKARTPENNKRENEVVVRRSDGMVEESTAKIWIHKKGKKGFFRPAIDKELEFRTRVTRVRSAGWKRFEGEPAWVKALPARAGYYRFVLNRKSNLLRIAKSNADRLAAKDARKHLQDKLSDVVPQEVLKKIADNAATHMQVVRRACSLRRLTRRAVPGNTLANAWLLCEVPVARLLEGVGTAHRASVKAGLGIAVPKKR